MNIEITKTFPAPIFAMSYLIPPDDAELNGVHFHMCDGKIHHYSLHKRKSPVGVFILDCQKIRARTTGLEVCVYYIRCRMAWLICFVRTHTP